MKTNWDFPYYKLERMQNLETKQTCAKKEIQRHLNQVQSNHARAFHESNPATFKDIVRKIIKRFTTNGYRWMHS